MKRMMLYFGSFDPVHNGHIALAEYVVEHDLADEVVLIVSPQSPYKQGALPASEVERFEMTEIACAASKYPGRIKPSAIEFLLPRPSYTIDTLHHLEEVCGNEMEFSILMGGDQIAALEGWKEYEKVLDYPIYVYPRRGERAERYLDRITLLTDAPLQDFSSTQVRAAIERGDDTSQMLAPGVAEYIRSKGLWSPAHRMTALNGALSNNPENTALLLERGKLHYRMNEWGAALNDFNAILRLDPENEEARQYTEMIQEILAFRYKDIYNP